MLTKEERATIDSYDRTAVRWAEEHNTKRFWGVSFDLFKALLPEGKLIEIGCGPGRDAETLVELGYDYTGSDPSSGLLAVARKRLPNQKFLQVPVYDLAFPASFRFDGFWAAASLLHVPRERISEALQKISALVRSDGIGFIAIKGGSGTSRVEDTIGEGEDRHRIVRHYVFYRADEFETLLVGAGFAPIMLIETVMGNATWFQFFVRRGA